LCLSIALVYGREASPEPKLQINNGLQPKSWDGNFVVALDVELGDKHFLCGGTLINSKTVLTAAHCVNSTKAVWVTYGSKDIRQPRTRNFDEVKAKEWHVHPEFKRNHDGMFNDIAVLILEHDVEHDLSHVAFALLPPPGHYTYKPGTKVATFGWGYTDKEGTPPDELQRSRALRIVDPAKFGYPNDPTVIVVHSKKSGICKGDSGGPLILDEDILIGVDSRGFSECVVGQPEVFTKVEPYLDWIKLNM